MRPVRRDIAMTGEITLRGKILAIGGLKEKSMAAYKSGVKTIYIPKDNVPDLEEIDSSVRESVVFVPVENFTEVINSATLEPLVIKEKNDGYIIPQNTKVESSVIRH
jgi:ATP-dependent Lon protease